MRWPFVLAPKNSNDSPVVQSGINHEVYGAHISLATDERPLVGDDELWEKTYEHRSFWMGEFARKTAPSGETQAIIKDRRFYDCDIYGPVIFGPLAPEEIAKVFVNCQWLEDEEARSLSPAEKRNEYVGAVYLEDCRFEGCKLQRVGVLKHPL